MKKPKTLLRDIFGFDEFRPGQREIIDAVSSKKNVLAIMPTGGGKSLCFQLPALMSEGLTVVISPLIALMRDQVRGLQAAGVAAGALTSGNTEDETDFSDPAPRTIGKQGKDELRSQALNNPVHQGDHAPLVTDQRGDRSREDFAVEGGSRFSHHQRGEETPYQPHSMTECLEPGEHSPEGF